MNHINKSIAALVKDGAMSGKLSCHHATDSLLMLIRTRSNLSPLAIQNTIDDKPAPKKIGRLRGTTYIGGAIARSESQY